MSPKGEIEMPTETGPDIKLGDHFRPFARKLSTVPKLIVSTVLLTTIAISSYLAVFVSNEIHAHGDPWLVSTIESAVTSPVMREHVTQGVRIASQHPLGFFVIATLLLVGSIATVSAIQVWIAIERGKIHFVRPTADTIPEPPARETTAIVPIVPPIVKMPTILASEVLPPPSIIADTPEPERMFVHQTAFQLGRLYKNRTSAQGDLLAQAFLGKWIRIAAPIHDVARYAERWIAYFQLVDAKDPDYSFFGIQVQLLFSTDWTSRLEVLQKGDVVAVEGKIKVIQATSIQLDNCELVDLND